MDQRSGRWASSPRWHIENPARNEHMLCGLIVCYFSFGESIGARVQAVVKSNTVPLDICRKCYDTALYLGLLAPDPEITQRAQQPKSLHEPNDEKHNNGNIENPLNRGIHGDESIDEPHNQTQHDKNNNQRN